MIACVDVDYRDRGAVAACVLVPAWTAETSAAELVESIAAVAAYEPGQFYKRELPCLLAVLRRVVAPLEAIVVDGYVWLTDETRPGLGGHLYQALAGRVPVIGVGKSLFRSVQVARPVWRGASSKPLYVTSAGMDVVEAARRVTAMPGPFRLPAMLKRVDQLCRGRTEPSTAAAGRPNPLEQMP